MDVVSGQTLTHIGRSYNWEGVGCERELETQMPPRLPLKSWEGMVAISWDEKAGGEAGLGAGDENQDSVWEISSSHLNVRSLIGFIFAPSPPLSQFKFFSRVRELQRTHAGWLTQRTPC